MMTARVSDAAWPALPLDAWRETYATLHMWTQVVGKVCLALTPRTNHFWNVAFHLTSCGLATPALIVGERALTLVFDFVTHRLILQCSDGRTETIPLEPRSVAEFYRMVMEALHRMGVEVHIWTMPVEIPDPIRFELDTIHRSYDRAQANAFWRTLVAIKPVFENFRCGFVGKCSPVHFFWGSFDLAVTRFSGRRAPERPGADKMTQEAYSHEVSSVGFWPGASGMSDAAFYSYAAPEPNGFKQAPAQPDAAAYNESLGEFLLPYEDVRKAESPSTSLLQFCQSTYEAAANLGKWDRVALEREAA